MGKILLEAYIDSEWGSDNEFICFQCMLHGGVKGLVKYIVFHEKYRDFLKKLGYNEGNINKKGFYLSFSQFQDHNDILSELVYSHLKADIEKNSLLQAKVDLYLFYSPKDFWCAIGFDQFQCFANTDCSKESPKIDQKRNIVGKFWSQKFIFENKTTNKKCFL